jgi:hypothetical protein
MVGLLIFDFVGRGSIKQFGVVLGDLRFDEGNLGLA